MSEITRGVIGMPFDMAMGSELSRRQFHDRAQILLADYEQLNSDYLKVCADFDAMTAQRDQLKAENDFLRNQLDERNTLIRHAIGIWKQAYNLRDLKGHMDKMLDAISEERK